MPTDVKPAAAVVVIFGAGGDLTWRKLIPALYNLFLDDWLPDRFAVIGVDRKAMKLDQYRQRLRQGVNRFSRRGKVNDRTWKEFISRVTMLSGDEFSEQKTYTELSRKIAALEKEWGAPANRVFYLAVPPMVVETITPRLVRARLTADPERARIVFEKPFGRDLATARELNTRLQTHFKESQIYRIDHYLGKETVQNILAFRFANTLFEPIWDRRYIDHVQITVAEQSGVEHRGSYYEHAGALRDMIQNHLMQLLCLIAMEPPVSFDADEIRNKKVDLLHAIRPIPPDRVHEHAVRGQYGSGWIGGKRVIAYRDEPDVDAESFAETLAAVKLFVDNWRWQDVPFYLRTGKRMPTKVSEVSIHFRPVPHQSFPSSAIGEWQSNRLVLNIQPEEGIMLRFQAKRPGPEMHLGSADMEFEYRNSFTAETAEAYETLLLDVLRGDCTLFMRDDQVEAAWTVITPVLQAWEAVTPPDFPNYAAGTWGPEAAEVLIAQDERSWLLPTVKKDGKKS